MNYLLVSDVGEAATVWAADVTSVDVAGMSGWSDVDSVGAEVSISTPRFGFDAGRLITIWPRV